MCASLTLAFLQRLQKDIPSEEIKTGEDDDDDNGDNLLKDSNDSESAICLGPVFICSAPQTTIANSANSFLSWAAIAWTF